MSVSGKIGAASPAVLSSENAFLRKRSIPPPGRARPRPPIRGACPSLRSSSAGVLDRP